jgi:hypothetical protein
LPFVTGLSLRNNKLINRPAAYGELKHGAVRQVQARYRNFTATRSIPINFPLGFAARRSGRAGLSGRKLCFEFLKNTSDSHNAASFSLNDIASTTTELSSKFKPTWAFRKARCDLSG